jgi:hypothetical protein
MDRRCQLCRHIRVIFGTTTQVGIMTANCKLPWCQYSLEHFVVKVRLSYSLLQFCALAHLLYKAAVAHIHAQFSFGISGGFMEAQSARLTLLSPT